ncbi:SMP-30/gluconolactonase/LRE family protein [Cellvibrio sp. OA-2007]|uniref:SMP-30/gluconolactonase/LRE family protein n=1 Tax=Cellvibrio sp. OA-2007 TaxID=529823 RepID=UPI000780281C|nr:SMP-30/gluconolactonase/LRE family protein [Cellvibrio sp. OA-2007]
MTTTKKATQKSLFISSLMVGLLATLAGCEKKPADTSVANDAATSSIAAEISVAAPVAACDGTAPAGDLTPVRIEAANTTRTEPGLFEGPVWINDSLYFSDFIFTDGFASRIQKLGADGTVTTAIEDSGSNGLAVDNKGLLVAGTHKYKGLSLFNPATGERTLIVDQFNGNPFNSPNDIAIAKDGTIYFTDPAFQRDAAPGGQEKTGVYRVATDGTVTLVDDTISNPNGIALSPEEDVLYVNGGGEQGLLRAYPIVDGMPQAGKDLVTGISIPDGMAIDCLGNIYLTEHIARQLRVYTPAGEQIAQATTDANLTNAAFGGAEGKTLFLTGAGSLWKIELDITGSSY